MMFAGLVTLALAFPPQSAPAARLFEGLGNHHRAVTTTSPLAQKYFDQGVALMNGFNHGEAVKSFKYATTLDPNCAMAYWGIAVADGPNINYPIVDPDRAKEATESLAKARSLEPSLQPVERALIEAATKRYAFPQPDDRSTLDKAYAEAMRDVWHSFPNDPDVGVLFAESLMDLRPWDLWSLDGQPRDITPEVETTLETVLKMDPNHPQALHLYIHTMEASPTPGRALAAADKLRNLQPGLGHMVHMPSHIDIRTGNWAKAEVANEKAISTDNAYRRLNSNPGLYRMYMTHNHQMLAFAATMRGEGQRAIKEMDAGAGIIPSDFGKDNAPFVDGYMAMPIEVRKRFGRWDEILAMPEFPDYFPAARAMRHADRAIAYAALGDTAKARAEASQFEEGAKGIPADYPFGNNHAVNLLATARHLMEGELLLADNKLDDSIAQLRQAVDAEDQLAYNEPPDWMQPTRHTLGAVLLKVGKFREAAAVYEKDLQVHPNNGWALFGLSKAYEGLGQKDKAKKAAAQFHTAWKDADLQLTSSCLCVKSVP